MSLAWLFSPCLFGHADPVKVLHGKALHFECERCQADLGIVLPNQMYRSRKVKKARKKKAAAVVTFQKRQA